MEKSANQGDKDAQKQDRNRKSGRNLDNRILVIGPTPEKLYEDGYREFVTISAPRI